MRDWVQWALGIKPVSEETWLQEGCVLRPDLDDVKQDLEFTSGVANHIDRDAYDVILLYAMEAIPYFLLNGTFTKNCLRVSIENSYGLGTETANKLFYNPLNAQLVAQPKETLSGNARHTRDTFTRGSQRLSVGDEYDGEQFLSNLIN